MLYMMNWRVDTEQKSSHRHRTRDQPDTFTRICLLNGVVQGQGLANTMFIMDDLGLEVIVVLVVKFRRAHGLIAVAKCGLYKLSGSVENGQHFSFHAFIYIFSSAFDRAVIFKKCGVPRIPRIGTVIAKGGYSPRISCLHLQDLPDWEILMPDGILFLFRGK